MGIAILTPTRERPDELRAMVDAIAETATPIEGALAVYVGIDDDDSSSYPTDGTHYVGEVVVKVQRGPRAQLAEWTNRLAVDAAADGFRILASFGDDHRPRTRGWDLAVRGAFNQHGKGLVYTRDGLQDERLPTAPFWSAEIIRALGFYFFPGCTHLYADDYWLKLARDLGRRHYLPEVLIEHLHPDAPNGHERDAINEANDAHYDADREALAEFYATGHAAALERCRAVL